SFRLPRSGPPESFEVVGLPFAEPGLYVVEVESAHLGAALLGKPKAMYVPTVALVTNLAVHFKWGSDSSLVWVTRLEDGRPVAGASVRIVNCKGEELFSGRTDDQGRSFVKAVPLAGALPTCKGE